MPATIRQARTIDTMSPGQRPRPGYYRAVRLWGGEWRRVGPWRISRHEATLDMLGSICPHYGPAAVETARGRICEATELQHAVGMDRYHRAMAHRDAVGVWG